MTLDQMLTSKDVAARIGITTMTIERWLRDPAVEFPKPRQVKEYLINAFGCAETAA